jgi:AcrR family transcriptional regulator
MAKTLNLQKHSDQKMRILSQARRLFASQGVKETSMSQVAKACKVTKATLYHYFKGKQALVREMLECCSREDEGNLRIKLTQARNLEECLLEMARNHLEQMKRPGNLEIMKILLSETLKNSDMKRFYLSFTNENLERGAREILAPFVQGRKSEKEVRLHFFQFLAALMHYTWQLKMLGDVSAAVGDEENFIRRLAKTFAMALQAP